jgi:zinc/manganese transport system ATP-binding protein
LSRFAFSVNIPNYVYGSIVALERVALHVPEGSLTAIIGPNGGGKSTFLKLLAGLYPTPPSATISCLYPHSSDKAFLPQVNEIDRTFPILVEDVIAMGLWPRIGPFRRLSAQLRPTLDEILKHVGLQGLQRRSLLTLSGGQLQRLFFGRLMAQDASIILLDEPFSAIDPTTTKDLMNLLQLWHKAGKTIIAVLHDLNLVRRFFPTTLLLAKTVIGYGPTAEVLQPETLAKAAFYV